MLKYKYFVTFSKPQLFNKTLLFVTYFYHLLNTGGIYLYILQLQCADSGITIQLKKDPGLSFCCIYDLHKSFYTDFHKYIMNQKSHSV